MVPRNTVCAFILPAVEKAAWKPVQGGLFILRVIGYTLPGARYHTNLIQLLLWGTIVNRTK